MICIFNFLVKRHYWIQEVYAYICFEEMGIKMLLFSFKFDYLSFCYLCDFFIFLHILSLLNIFLNLFPDSHYCINFLRCIIMCVN